MVNPKFHPVLAPGSLIIVTGANGYIAGHVCDQALAAGYHVRGTVRSLARTQWLQDLFDTKYGAEKYSRIVVQDTFSPGAFDAAAKDADAFVHIATDIDIPPQPEAYVDKVTAGALYALESAAKEKSIRRFVLTSSTMGAAPWQPGVEYTLHKNSYNEQWWREAYAGPFDDKNRWKVYGVSKMNSEKAAWKWVAENNPSFVFNTTLPAANFGKSISGDWNSTGTWPKLAVDGDFSIIKHVSSQYFVDVVDMAKLYLGAVIHPEVKGERIWGASEPYDWDKILGIVKTAYPNLPVSKGIADAELDYPGVELGNYDEPKARSEWLLKEMGQEGGWTSLEESLVRCFKEPSGVMAGGLGNA